MNFKRLGVPGVVIAVPSWAAPAKALARSADLLQKQVVTIPISNLFGDSEEAGRVMSSRAGDIISDIIDALREASGGGPEAGRISQGRTPAS